jgi:NodT family efflux transporter outer membrane factor (OMF) lipoprotein
VGPNYRSPEVKTPGAFGEAPTGSVATTQRSDPIGGSTRGEGAATQPGTGGRLSGQVADLVVWWKSFDDPMLDSLIERAVENNLDVRQATARLREARAQLGVTSAALWPSVDVNGQVSRSRSSKSISGGSFSGGSSGSSGGGTSVGSFGKTESTLYRGGFDASWEIDVFGGTRRAVEAARYDIEAAVEDRNAVITSLLAELATNYVTVRGAQQRIRIAIDNIESQKQTLSLNEARLQAGISSEFDVARARAQVATFEATVPSLRIQEAQAMHRIGVLLGDSPDSVKAMLSEPKAIPMSLPTVPVGLPSELVRRRPDIRRAERQLAASTARIGVATADLFPRFSLTGSLGLQSDKLARFADSRSIFYSVGPAVSWNIFDAGRIRSNIQVQNERQAEFVAAYERTVLTSLEDVENAVVAYSRNVERREALARAVLANRRSVELATGRFAGGQGVGNLLDVLVAQRDLFSAEDALVQSDQQLSQDLVALYKALGGGWETFTGPERKAVETQEKPTPAPNVSQPAPAASAKEAKAVTVSRVSE